VCAYGSWSMRRPRSSAVVICVSEDNTAIPGTLMSSWLAGECWIVAALHWFLRRASACLKRRGDGRNPYFTIEPQNKVPGSVGGSGVLCSILIGGHFHKSKGKRSNSTAEAPSIASLAGCCGGNWGGICDTHGRRKPLPHALGNCGNCRRSRDLGNLHAMWRAQQGQTAGNRL
jgi:hypothetical protein